MSWRQGSGAGAGAGDDGRGRSREQNTGNGRWRRGRTPPRRRPAEAGGGGSGGGGGGRGGGSGSSSAQQHHHPHRRGPGPSTWDLKAQRRERALWGEGVQALEAMLQQADGATEGRTPPAGLDDDGAEGQQGAWGALRAEMAAVEKVLDELSTVRLVSLRRRGPPNPPGLYSA